MKIDLELSFRDRFGSGLRRVSPRAISVELTVKILLVIAVFAPTIAAHAVHEFWRERRGIVERSDIVLFRPNVDTSEAMPLGNGRLGAAAWTPDGLAIQLNRGDTFPGRLSSGQVFLEGLKKLVRATDFQGRLNLYDGELSLRGAAMQATVYIDETLDALVVDVKGADPLQVQTVKLQLWTPRKPDAIAKNGIAFLAETWLDNKEAGASNERFGSLAAITADGLDVRASVADPLTVTLSFRPHADGSFRLLAAAPEWHGGEAFATSAKLLETAKKLDANDHRVWWHGFWDRTALMKLASPDHSAEYFENLRTIYLYSAAAEGRGRFPGSQAGIADLFFSIRDMHQWSPSAFWHWNLRMQVSANLGAGLADINDPYFRLYRENLENILAWTRKHMSDRPGICVPETMRFNGQGWENETWMPKPALNCAEDSQPYYNARTISTGAEVSLWVLDQYEYTGDLEFLKQNYPILRETARFLLAYGKRDVHGILHTEPSNSHEMQWDVRDPITDVSAMRALFPRFVRVATILNSDTELVKQVEERENQLPELPLVSLTDPGTVLSPDADLSNAILVASHLPSAPTHNSENIGLEPIWPYGLIGDDGPMHDVAVRTFMHRPYKNQNDWSFDPIHAVRLELAEEFRTSLEAITERYQSYPSGFASFANGPEFYIEQIGVAAAAMQMALADDYNGMIRIAAAWPKSWDVDGTVYLRHRNKVNVRIRGGRITRIELMAGSSGPLRIRNPWPGEAVQIASADSPDKVLHSTSEPVISLTTSTGATYLIRRAASSGEAEVFEPVSDVPASSPKKLGSRSIGLTK